MKTSKIIFLSLLTAIALLILAAIIDVRLTGKKGNEPVNLVSNEIPVPPFSVLVVNNCANLALRSGPSPLLKVSSNSKTAPEISYMVKNDTMTISKVSKVNNNNQPIFVNIEFVSLRKMIVNNSSAIHINVTDLAEFNLDAVSSNVYLNASPEKYESREIRFNARNHSKISSGNFKARNLGIVLEMSEARMMIKAENINGSISNESHLTILQPAELSMKSDLASILSITQYYGNNPSKPE